MRKSGRGGSNRELKRTVAISLFLVLVPSGLLLAGQSAANSAQSQGRGERKPDLIPILHSPMDQEIRIKNVGSGPARPSKLTLDCVKLGAASQMYSCPNLPVSAAPIYFDEAFPDNATVKVPALAPGETFAHKLAFWDVSSWPMGQYKFTVTADAAHELKESNVDNNVATILLLIH
jgi:hypothetical protein